MNTESSLSSLQDNICTIKLEAQNLKQKMETSATMSDIQMLRLDLQRERDTVKTLQTELQKLKSSYNQSKSEYLTDNSSATLSKKIEPEIVDLTAPSTFLEKSKIRLHSATEPIPCTDVEMQDKQKPRKVYVFGDFVTKIPNRSK